MQTPATKHFEQFSKITKVNISIYSAESIPVITIFKGDPLFYPRCLFQPLFSGPCVIRPCEYQHQSGQYKKWTYP